ncbi:hypothetical protein SASPL_149995 [Salvia splendens]|uniref:Uncharacterized protein n=1 Tax=Salvia splendens TaxID=180675 RepID=A0A8X8W5Z9_SALSN|nr:hypothetical protein SASPL_149995 [Salvia splendens]
MKDKIEIFLKKTSEDDWKPENWIVQLWAPKMVLNRLCLATRNQPYAVGTLTKDIDSFRKKCMEHYYVVDDEAKNEELGPPGRVFRNRQPEITSDLFQYTTQEFSIRSDAMYCCNEGGYFAFPIFDDENNHQCDGVLEFVGFPHCHLRRIARTLEILTVKEEALIEICNLLQQSYGYHRQIVGANVWVNNGECVSSSNTNMTCMELALSTDYVGIYLSTNVVPRDENVHTIHVNGRKGIVGIALVCESKACFCPDIESYLGCPYITSSRLDPGCVGCFAICMQNSHTGDLVYVMEFYISHNNNNGRILQFLKFLLQKMERKLKTFKMACGKELGEDLVVQVIDINGKKVEKFVLKVKGKDRPDRKQIRELRSLSLKFTKNLLKLDNALDTEDATVKRVLLPHLDKLICGLHCIFTKNNATKRPLIKYPGKREITIFNLLSVYVKEPSDAKSFVEILLIFLAKKRLNFDTCDHALKIIGRVVTVLGSGISKKILSSLSPLLISADLGIRSSICDVLDIVASSDSSLLTLANILRGLNATSAMEMSGLDHDTVLSTYEKVNVKFFYTIGEKHALPILAHAILNAYPEPDRMWSRAIVNSFLLKHMGNAMNKEGTGKKMFPANCKSYMLLVLAFHVEISNKNKAFLNMLLVLAFHVEISNKNKAFLNMLLVLAFHVEISNKNKAFLNMLLVLAFHVEISNKNKAFLNMLLVLAFHVEISNKNKAFLNMLLVLAFHVEISNKNKVLGLLVEVMGMTFQNHLIRVLPAVRNILQSAVNALASTQQDLSDVSVIPFWKEAYYSLVMLGKILNQFHYLFLDRELEAIWETICEFLLHPHLWLRNISCQILSSYFTAVDNSKASADAFYLMRPSILFHLAVSLCCQLKVPSSDDAGKVIMQNLVFSISHLHSFFEKNEHMDVSSFWSSLDSAEQDRFLKAFGILDPRKGNRTLKLYISDSDQHDKNQHPFISYFLQRMGKLTFQMEANQV